MKQDSFADTARQWSHRLNRGVEYLCALLMVLLVLDVWAGVVARYVLQHSLPWTEELARYLMIWMALLAVSCAIVHREHIGLDILRQRLPRKAERMLFVLIDGLGFCLFAVLGLYGLAMAQQGIHQYANIFGMTMALPFAAVPVSSLLACIQLVLRGAQDFHRLSHPEPEEGCT